MRHPTPKCLLSGWRGRVGCCHRHGWGRSDQWSRAVASKTAAALKYYQQVVKDYPDTTQAKDAAARVKVLGGK